MKRKFFLNAIVLIDSCYNVSFILLRLPLFMKFSCYLCVVNTIFMNQQMFKGFTCRNGENIRCLKFLNIGASLKAVSHLLSTSNIFGVTFTSFPCIRTLPRRVLLHRKARSVHMMTRTHSSAGFLTMLMPVLMSLAR